MAVSPPVRVILVTDGDPKAQRAVEMAARNLGLRCISASAGAPTPLTAEELVALIRRAHHDPVLVMFDDCGNPGRGKGEATLQAIAAHPDIQVLGAIAVASQETRSRGVAVTASVTADGRIVPTAVDKEGQPRSETHLHGDTVGVLQHMEVPLIIGVGDLGKQRGADAAEVGAPLTTAAAAAILSLSGMELPGPQR